MTSFCHHYVYFILQDQPPDLPKPSLTVFKIYGFQHDAAHKPHTLYKVPRPLQLFYKGTVPA